MDRRSVNGSEDIKSMAEPGDLEEADTKREGDVEKVDADSARREWIKHDPESPRNWPVWVSLAGKAVLFSRGMGHLCL